MAPVEPVWDPDPPTDRLEFDQIRQRGIVTAQDASGQIWTDYNLHDPGVTLLEQTAYALTEVGYAGDHAVRDHLTRDWDFQPEDSASPPPFDADGLALFGPYDVLPGRPVTLQDIGRRLTDLEGVDRVFVRQAPTPGLVDLMIIPTKSLDTNAQGSAATTTEETKADIRDTVRQAYEEDRLLTSGINRLEIAKPHAVVIQGRVEVSPLADPDTIVAEIYFRITTILHGLANEGSDVARPDGYDRSDVFEDPARVWPQVAADTAIRDQAQSLLVAVQSVEGVLGVQNLHILDAKTLRPVTQRDRRYGVFPDPKLPGAPLAPDFPPKGAPMRLTLWSDGTELALDEDQISHEFRRISAAEITRQGNRLDRRDWDVQQPGRHRPVELAPVDLTLPLIYRAQADLQRNGGLARYRAMIDSHLADIAGTLSALPDTFAANAPIDPNDPADVARRCSVLDYLIALQGEAMPATAQTDIHTYRSHVQRATWEVLWRESYLARLPLYNRYQGTAHPDYGFAARLAHLADLPLGPIAKEDAPEITADPAADPPAPDGDLSNIESRSNRCPH